MKCVQEHSSRVNVQATVMNGWFKKLEDAGFRLMTLEPVTLISNSQVELAFLHKDWDPKGAAWANL